MKLTIAIDGPSGAGKSTVAKRVAAALGHTYIDTGAMYRAVAWKGLGAGVSHEDEARTVLLAESSSITFEQSAQGQRVLLDGEDLPLSQVHLDVALPGIPLGNRLVR